jgi:hypothetical protein
MEFAYGTEINFQCDNLWFNSWNLDTSNFHLALDKSILTIANYSWNWKLDPKLGSLIEQNLSGRLQALVFILSEEYRKNTGDLWLADIWTFELWDIGRSFGDVDDEQPQLIRTSIFGPLPSFKLPQGSIISNTNH